MVLTYESKNAQQKLSNNFRVGEFVCKCGQCGKALVDQALVERLQQIRDHFDAPVNITSGYRCKAHNTAVGGDPNSSHMQGMAADIVVPGTAPQEVAKYAESIGVQRIGLYDSFVHIGSGLTKRFWLGHDGEATDTFGAEQSFTVELPVLRRGSRGEAVKALQTQLVGWGYAIETDGSFGPATESAMKKYQSEHGISAHGVADRPTRQSLLGISEG